LQTLLHNLLDNALRYVPTDRQLAIDLSATADELTLQVADDGPGIAEAERELVFERFYRVAGHDAPGSGLGLAIVRQTAAALGGSVTLGPGLGGRGCRFTVTLPRKAQKP
jgi:two-component system sensor histidine kinase QseC